MRFVILLFGPPHEALHVLALWLVGRRATRVTRGYVDIPDDLTTRQYVFVAGLPALVFWGAAGIAILAALNAKDLPALLLSLAGLVVAVIAGMGTIGDLQLIAARLLAEQRPPS